MREVVNPLSFWLLSTCWCPRLPVSVLSFCSLCGDCSLIHRLTFLSSSKGYRSVWTFCRRHRKPPRLTSAWTLSLWPVAATMTLWYSGHLRWRLLTEGRLFTVTFYRVSLTNLILSIINVIWLILNVKCNIRSNPLYLEFAEMSWGWTPYLLHLTVLQHIYWTSCVHSFGLIKSVQTGFLPVVSHRTQYEEEKTMTLLSITSRPAKDGTNIRFLNTELLILHNPGRSWNQSCLVVLSI